MNRRVRDALVGVFILGGCVLAVIAYLWFSGRIEQGRRSEYAAYFDDVSGLRTGDPVQVRGIERGRVLDIGLDGDRVKVRIALDRDVALTEDTRVAIRSVSYLGSDRYLMVTPGTSSRAAPGARFDGQNEALDLEETFLRLDRMLSSLDPTRITAELARARDDLVRVIDSGLASFTHDFGRATDDLGRVASGVDTLVRMLDSESSAGKLLTSAELYDELRQTNVELKALVTDIREHPERYVKVKFSLFR
jgi:phospholipid/cholesterol/gamma-HCH transport system substrate-binding protein